jgi:hypothetical protein
VIPRRRRTNAVGLVVLVVLLGVAIYVLWRVFIAIPPAPPPKVIRGLVPFAPCMVAGMDNRTHLAVDLAPRV